MSIKIYEGGDNSKGMFWIIARRNYKVVKLIFNEKAYEASLMVAEQSFELYIKGLLDINNIKYNTNHNLIKNLELGKSQINCFNLILNNENYKTILTILGDNFTNIRYGNHKGVQIDNIFFTLMDEIELILDKCFFETMKNIHPNVHYKNWSFEEYRKKSNTGKLNKSRIIFKIKKMILKFLNIKK